MYNFTLKVVLIFALLAGTSVKFGRLQYLALKLHHPAIKLNFPILEFPLIKNLIHKFARTVKSFLRVLDFVNINSSHFLFVFGKIIRQACLVAEFWD
jgi:hypothetical protein